MSVMQKPIFSAACCLQAQRHTHISGRITSRRNIRALQRLNVTCLESNHIRTQVSKSLIPKSANARDTEAGLSASNPHNLRCVVINKPNFLYRVTRNNCRGFNNLSYTIHLRQEYMYFFYLIEYIEHL